MTTHGLLQPFQWLAEAIQEKSLNVKTLPVYSKC